MKFFKFLNTFIIELFFEWILIIVLMVDTLSKQIIFYLLILNNINLLFKKPLRIYFLFLIEERPLFYRLLAKEKTRKQWRRWCVFDCENDINLLDFLTSEKKTRFLIKDLSIYCVFQLVFSFYYGFRNSRASLLYKDGLRFCL